MSYEYLLTRGYIDETGILVEDNFSQAKHYWLDFGMSNNIYYHYKELVNKLLSKRPAKILNDIWSKEQILSNLNNGDLFLVQGAFYFKNNPKRTSESIVYRKAFGIRVYTTINKWYCNSASAIVRLSRRNVVTLVGIVQNVERDGDEITIKCTALSIGSFMKKISNGRFVPEAKEIQKEEQQEAGGNLELIDQLDIGDIDEYLPF